MTASVRENGTPVGNPTLTTRSHSCGKKKISPAGTGERQGNDKTKNTALSYRTSNALAKWRIRFLSKGHDAIGDTALKGKPRVSSVRAGKCLKCAGKIQNASINENANAKAITAER